MSFLKPNLGIFCVCVGLFFFGGVGGGDGGGVRVLFIFYLTFLLDFFIFYCLVI